MPLTTHNKRKTMSNLKVIISREFSERVRKKSFIITTIIMPLFMVAMMILPAVIMNGNIGSDTKHIVVVDETDGTVVGKSLKSDSSVEFEMLENITRTDAVSRFDKDESVYGILWIDSDAVLHPDHIQLITNSSSSVMTEENIENQISEILRDIKLKSYGIEEIDRILSESQVNVSLSTMRYTGDKESMEETSSALSMAVSLILGMILYMFIIIYGQQVLTGVIEEKQTRVLDVMVTSCSPFDLMMGKILGVAAVAAVQVAIWCVIVCTVSAFIMPMIMSPDTVQAMSATEASLNITFGNVMYVLELFLWLLLFIVGGFLLYASLFAAAGSAVDANQDAQQFNTILMMPIILSIMVMMMVFNDPDSKLVFWCSMIPFTSPIVMMARIPFDIPVWQIILSLVILYVSFLLTTVIAARIYRIGIFTHGKKPSWKELGTWLFMK